MASSNAGTLRRRRQSKLDHYPQCLVVAEHPPHLLESNPQAMKRVAFPHTSSSRHDAALRSERVVFRFEAGLSTAVGIGAKSVEPSAFANDRRWSASCEKRVEIVEIQYSDREHVGDVRTRAYAHHRVFEAFRRRQSDTSSGCGAGARSPRWVRAPSDLHRARGTWRWRPDRCDCDG